MCGRTACTLAPDEVCKACSSRALDSKGNKQYRAADWHDHPGNHNYSPRQNVAPTSFTPVMLSERHVRGVKRQSEGEEVPSKYVIQPMMWGLIPPFYKGPSATGHGFKTNNCRVEDIEEKKSYKPSLLKGQRCVVLCDGFYEWQSTKGEKDKQPYFIYAPQPEGVEIWNRDTWDKPDVWSAEEGWKGPRLLKIAGLFSSWTSTEGEEVMSYTVVTMESGKKFGELHHRVPAILETDQDVEDWLDHSRLGYKEALANLKNETEITWHPVSKSVNNSRNQEGDLMSPASLDQKPKETASSKLMASWLSKAPPKQSGIKKEPTTPDSIKKESQAASVKKEVKPSPLAKWLKKEPKNEKE